MEIFKIAGENLYFDLEKISDFVRIKEDDTKNFDDLLNKSSNNDTEKEINSDYVENIMIDMTKWDLVKSMIETVLSENGIIDENMGITKLGEQLSIPFRLSFNTLVKHNLINKK